MKWKLWTLSQGHQPQDKVADQFDSEAAALTRACKIIRHQLSWKVQVLYIEGPNGEHIDGPKIAALCKDRAGPPGIERGRPGP